MISPSPKGIALSVTDFTANSRKTSSRDRLGLSRLLKDYFGDPCRPSLDGVRLERFTRRMVKMAVQRGRSKRRGEAYSLRYLEPLNAVRTKPTDYFTILIGFTDQSARPNDGMPSIPESHGGRDTGRPAGRHEPRQFYRMALRDLRCHRGRADRPTSSRSSKAPCASDQSPQTADPLRLSTETCIAGHPRITPQHRSPRSGTCLWRGSLHETGYILG